MNQLTKKAAAATVAVALGLSAAAVSPVSADDGNDQAIHLVLSSPERDAAVAAIDSALEDGLTAKDLKKAIKELEKGDEKAADGKADDAAKKYEKAIEKVAKAVEKAAKKAGDGGDDGGEVEGNHVIADPGDFDGRWSAYQFTFYNLDTGETFTVEGNNLPDNPLGTTEKSNEGFIEVGGDKLMLHVSCSDAFTNGIGQKSDPSADSPWRVVDFVITKYSGSEIDKTCPMSGNFTPPTPPPSSGPVV